MDSIALQGFDKETHGYYKQSGEGLLQKAKSFLPSSTWKIQYNKI
ncbi:DUF4765 family protein [Salmonella enterica]|nr:DUF4765 family protein [Salmonella enterica]